MTIGKRQGKFPGMLLTQKFKIVLVKAGHGAGLEDTKKPDAIVRYEGEEVRISGKG